MSRINCIKENRIKIWVIWMTAPSSLDKKIIVVIVDMQEGMWGERPLDEGESELGRKIQESLVQKRLVAMESLSEDLGDFVDEMRANGAHIVWAMTKESGSTQYGGLFNLKEHSEDSIIWKKAQSAYVDNIEFFEDLKQQAQENAQDLEIKVCGVWALECIANTDISLHWDGFHSRIIGDLILDSVKPSQDADRPNNYEANALYQAAHVTNRQHVAEWSEDVLMEQKVAFMRTQELRPFDPGL